ncbi:MAG: hypothetical protein LBJ38_02265 [Oscillospiraceae bacterium]|jgi:hypothetical protein|nr:hypothetical protein [Oscillospiraceae bacterium]
MRVPAKFIRRLLLLCSLIAIVVMVLVGRTKRKQQEFAGAPAGKEATQKALSKPEKVQSELEEEAQPGVFDIYNPLNWHEHYEEIKERLNNQPVVSAQSMREYLKSQGRRVSYSTEVYKVTLQDGTDAVFKPGSGAEMEEAVSDLANSLGLGYVPPVVRREVTINGKSGTKSGLLSLYVPTDIDACTFSVTQMRDKLSTAADENDVVGWQCLNFLVGNYDLDFGNLLLASAKNSRVIPVSIDNEGIRRVPRIQYGELPFVRWRDLGGSHDQADKPFPFVDGKPCDESARRMLKNQYGIAVTRREHSYAIYNGYYYAQFTDEDPFTFMICPEELTAKTATTLKDLTKEKVVGIISKSVPDSAPIDEIASSVMDRRDALLQHFGLAAG